MIVREGIIEVLKTTGAYHADDLDHLGIPDEHRNIIGSQTAKLVNQKWIEEAGRRKSILPSRNGAKSGTYRLTPLGKQKLVGNSSGRCGDSLPAAVSGETPVADGALTGGSAHVSAPGSSDEAQSGRDRQVRAAGCATSGFNEPQGEAEAADATRRTADSQPGRHSDQPLVEVNAGRPASQERDGLGKADEEAGVHLGKSSAAVSRDPQGSGGVSTSPPCAAAEPACLPGFEESAAARHLQDAA